MSTYNNESALEEIKHQILSNEVREIMFSRPNWLVRNGIMLFGIIVFAITGISHFIRYPDTVSAKARLASINAPKEVKTKTDGKLVKLMAKENMEVAQGQTLGFIESSADHTEVLGLSAMVDSMQVIFDNNINKDVLAMFSRPYQHLGEIQQAYQTFTQYLGSFKQYLGNGYYLKKKALLQADIGYLQKLHNNLLAQKNIQLEDLGLADSTFNMNKRLREANAIGGLEYRNERSTYLNKAMAIPQINANITNNESSQHEKQKDILQLENEIAQQRGIFSQALNTLKAQLDDWKNKYVLTAPIAGKVAFASFLQENQQLHAGQPICFVSPSNCDYYAEMIIPQYNFGKVSIGQEVLLKFPAFPYQEFGSVRGSIVFISHIPTDSGYLARVSLPNGLSTNYQKQVQYRDGLLAQGEIITKDIRLLQRFVNSLIGQVKK